MKKIVVRIYPIDENVSMLIFKAPTKHQYVDASEILGRIEYEADELKSVSGNIEDLSFTPDAFRRFVRTLSTIKDRLE